MIGEVPFKGEVLHGEQPRILDRDLFDAVQAKLSEQTTSHRTTRMNSAALLTGRIFDDRGNRMSPSHVRKGADGFAWNGKTYPSLSKAAFAITGTRWNGPKFFGLRDKPAKASSP